MVREIKEGLHMRTGAFTGDSTNITLYFAIAALALIFLLFILLLKRRKDKEEDQ